MIIERQGVLPGNLSFSAESNLNINTRFDESVSGMIFDIALRENMTGQSVFYNSPTAEYVFGGGHAVALHSMGDVETYGITSDLMNGVPYYHLKQYFEYVGADKITPTLYLSFRRFENEEDEPVADYWVDAIEDMQTDAEGGIFQIGVWTEYPLVDDHYNVNEWLSYAHQAVVNLNGVIGQVSYSNNPLNLILFPCIMDANNPNSIKYRELPDLSNMNMPFVSIILGQDASEEVHNIQESNVFKTPVGFMGKAMACLSLAGAEESIGYAKNYDLNKNDDMSGVEYGFGPNNLPMNNISYRQQVILSQKGYIVPTSYTAIEEGAFFSNDQTLSAGDYKYISRGRLIHKVRRIVRYTLLPYINEHMFLNEATGYLSSAAISDLTLAISTNLEQYLKNRDENLQCASRYIDIPENQRILENDMLSINLSITPLETANEIHIIEKYTITD